MSKTKLFCAVLVLTALAMNHAYARNMVVAISPYMKPAAAKAQNIKLLKFLTELEAGDEIILLDAFNLSIIGEFNIPDDPAYKNPKARLAVNRSAVGALMRFTGKVTAPGADAHPVVSGAVRLPQLLRYIANNFAGGDRLDVIVLGSPLYDDPKEPVFSMANGHFPSDGHLFASQSKTPFGAAGHPDLFKNLHVHIGYGNEQVRHNDRHGYFVERFWALYVEQQGGKLASFVGDLPTLFRRIKHNVTPANHHYTPVKSGKLEMIRLRLEENKQSIYDRPLSTAQITKAQIRRANHVEIGISWQCGECDLDLYARATPGAPILYFGHAESAQGRYWKDYRNSPTPTNGFETIAFKIPLDLRVLLIAVNFYEGIAQQGVSGELRLSIDGDTYASTFHIAATTGNQGKGALEAIKSGHANQNQSIIINPLRILGLQ